MPYRLLLMLPLLAATASPALAAEPKPEITRAAAKPQSPRVLHTVRAIPEACTRLEGIFTGQVAEPYRLAVVRTSPACQARARFVDAAQAKPSTQTGWVLNDLIRVPSAGCQSQQAVVRVWRKPGSASPPALDAQGRARVYLKDAQQGTKAIGAATPMFAAMMVVAP